MRSFATYAAAVSIAAFVSGCSPALKVVTMEGLQGSLNKTITKEGTRSTTTTDISASVTVDDFPLLKEVCGSSYNKSATYDFDGSMMRFKLNHYSYKVPLEGYPDSGLYVHNYAVCSSFYALPNGTNATQEAVTVRYIGASRSNYEAVLAKIDTISGGAPGLLLDAGFHTGAAVENNSWPSVERKTFDPENLLYLKMEEMNMKVINQYDGDEFGDILAFEYVHANVTRNAGGEFSFAPDYTAIIQEVFTPRVKAAVAQTSATADDVIGSIDNVPAKL